MPFGPDQRPDLSGVPSNLQRAPKTDRYGIAWQRNSTFWRLFRIAAVLCAVAAIVLALGFAGYNFQRWGMVTEATVHSEPVEQSEQRLEQTQAIYQGALRDAAKASNLAKHQHEQAMKAVEAAKALAKNPESPELQAALDRAMDEIAQSAENPLPADRKDWKAEDYARAMREGRSLTD
ncbi:MAG: hypothetical protein KDE32_08755 [Novosphingobium sp.]|nr:hypothetical protein [Novosphingobium sp.]